ncbi:hypothetical protein Tco_1524495 [Tanacetum coccineum]
MLSEDLSRSQGRTHLGIMVSRDSPLIWKHSLIVTMGGSTVQESNNRWLSFLGQRLIHGNDKKQTIVCHSTTEAEYVAAAHWLSILGVEKSEEDQLGLWKRKCQVSLANWMQVGCKSCSITHTIPPSTIPVKQSLENASARTLADADLNNLNCISIATLNINYCKSLLEATPIADALRDSYVAECLPQPSADLHISSLYQLSHYLIVSEVKKLEKVDEEKGKYHLQPKLLMGEINAAELILVEKKVLKGEKERIND